MKIISLNTWGGIAGAQNLIEFFKEHQGTDVFCLQEIFNGGQDEPEEQSEDIESKVYDLLSLIKEALPKHEAFFKPHVKDYYGLAMFVKKNLSVAEEGERFVHQEKGYTLSGDLGFRARNIQFVTLETPKGLRTIINFHGLWNGGGKTDTEHRLNQSRKIIDFIKTLKNDFVLCGDFNLEPKTESLKMFEEFGLKNLIKDFNFISTRTKFYTKPVKFADYAFVSSGIIVSNFKVLPDEVSDHSPLYLDFE